MVIIVDGNHLASRCYFAIDPLTTSKGHLTNVTYGCINTIRSYKKRFGNAYLIIVWDGRGKKEEHKIYEQYKADRKAFPEEYYIQIKDTQNILNALNVIQFQYDNIEADDVIGTITYKARKKGQKVVIISSDHDFEQLISSHVQIIIPSLAIYKEKTKDYNYVLERYVGLKPSQLVEMMSLTGDDSDNLDGIDGIGNKIAARLIKANGSLENVISNVDNLKTYNKKNELIDAPDNLKTKIKNNIETIKICNKVVALNCHLDVDVKFEHTRQIHIDRLKELFINFEFKSFLNEIDQWQSIFSR